MPTLRPHQQKIVDDSPLRCGLFLEQRVGKTPTSISLASKNASSCLVITPKSLQEQWKEEIELWKTGKCIFEVISKETFRRDFMKIGKYDSIIVDECFLTGTRVKTLDGYRNIEDIKIGDKVYNCDGVGTVRNVSIREKDRYLKIKFSNSKTVNVTENHKFLTTDGWIEAKDLKNKKILLTNIFNNSIMSSVISNYRKKYEKISSRNNLFNLWKKVLFKKIQNKKNLLQKMSKKVYENENDRIYEKESELVKDFFRKYEKISQRKSFYCYRVINKNEKKQSDEKSRDKDKGIGNIKENRTRTKNKRWKRERDDNTTENIISCIRRWLESRICCMYKEDNKKCSLQLQNRYCKSEKDDGNRSRWTIPLLIKKTRTRHKKREMPRTVRVESIEVQESRSIRKSKQGFKVYNLEVSGHPSYIVEEMFVHNCHMGFANHKNKMFKALDSYIKNYKIVKIWLLTGTPYTSNSWSVYSLGKLLGKDWSWYTWNKTFFDRWKMGNRYIPKQKNHIEKPIANIVNKLGIVIKLEDVVDLPEQMFRNEYFDLNKVQKDAIVEAFDPLAIVRFVKQHQIESGTLKGDGYVDDLIIPCEKTKRVVELCEENKKIAIIARYNFQLEMYRLELLKQFKDRPIYVINGSTKDKNEIIKKIALDDKCIVLINSMCDVGYSISSISIMVFASMGFSFVNYVQMCSRIKNMEKTEPNLYIHLLSRNSDSIDRGVLASVGKKQNFDIEIFNRK